MGSVKGVNPEYRTAADTSRRALMEHPDVKTDVKKTTDKVDTWSKKNVGLSKEDLVYAGYAAPLAFKKISTKPFKNLKYTIGGFNFRPEIEYSWGNNPEHFRAFFILNKEF